MDTADGITTWAVLGLFSLVSLRIFAAEREASCWVARQLQERQREASQAKSRSGDVEIVGGASSDVADVVPVVE